MQSFQHCNSWNGSSALSDVKSDSLVLLYNVTHTFGWSSHFWCDFQAQQTNLVQVARSLGRAVPLSPQFIFTPTASVTAVQPETSALSIYTPPTSGQVTLIYTSLTYIYTNMCCFLNAPLKSLLSFSAQVQNLALRGQQGALTSSLSQSQLQSLSVKQCPGASAQLSVTNQPVARLKSPGAEPNSQGAAAKSSPAETSSETVGKNYKISDLTTRELNMCPNVTSVAGHPLISTGKPSLSGCCLHMQMQWKCSVSIVLQMEEWKQQEKLKCEGHLALSIKRGVGLLWQRCWGAHRAAVFHDNTPAMCVCGWWDSFSLWNFQCFFTCIWIMHCIASCFSVIHKLNGKHPGNFCQDIIGFYDIFFCPYSASIYAYTHTYAHCRLKKMQDLSISN